MSDDVPPDGVTRLGQKPAAMLSIPGTDVVVPVYRDTSDWSKQESCDHAHEVDVSTVDRQQRVCESCGALMFDMPL